MYQLIFGVWFWEYEAFFKKWQFLLLDTCIRGIFFLDCAVKDKNTLRIGITDTIWFGYDMFFKNQTYIFGARVLSRGLCEAPRHFPRDLCYGDPRLLHGESEPGQQMDLCLARC